MFNKTKRKIVITVVISLLALMTVTLTTIYLSNRIALRKKNEEMLQTYAERYTLEEKEFYPDGQIRPDGLPDIKPDGQDAPWNRRDDRRGKNEPAFRLSTFYSVTFSENGDVLAVDSGNKELMDEQTLIQTASDILGKRRKSGKTGSITYLVDKRDTYTLVAMIDGTIDDSNQALLIKQMLIIGSIAMAALFALSVFLANRIVEPLEENDRRQKRFVSDAGHELKTPIAVISANSELLRRETGDSEWLDNIDYENERMSDLVGQLLVLSKAQNGDLPKETVDFSKLTDGEVLPFESLAFEKGKRINSDIMPEIYIDGNQNQLRQLVSILLDNALSHGTGEQIDVSLGRERHNAVLTVSNQAEEIKAEQLSHLFERFYRADEARNESGSHYGLGLSIAKAVTEAHGGDIRADYKDGRAIFTVSLPAKKTDKN